MGVRVRERSWVRELVGRVSVGRESGERKCEEGEREIERERERGPQWERERERVGETVGVR